MTRYLELVGKLGGGKRLVGRTGHAHQRPQAEIGEGGQAHLGVPGNSGLQIVAFHRISIFNTYSIRVSLSRPERNRKWPPLPLSPRPQTLSCISSTATTKGCARTCRP